MTIRAYYDVWCDGIGDGEEEGDCGQWAEGATALDYEGKRMARKRAKQFGWRRTADGRDLCPECAATDTQRSGAEPPARGSVDDGEQGRHPRESAPVSQGDRA